MSDWDGLIPESHRNDAVDSEKSLLRREDGWEELREAANKLAEAVLSWQSGHVLEGLARDYRAIVDRLAAARGEPPTKRKRTDWSNVVVDEGDEAP